VNLSLLERRCLGALELAGKILGETDFTLAGLPGTHHGVFSEFSEEREISDKGGSKVSVTGTIVCANSQFGRKRPALGMRMEILGRTMRVVKVDHDSISHTLWLGHVNS